MGQKMAAALHITPSRATSSNGLNLDGAKWYFYQTGTTTPQSVYTTAALDTTHANPVVADAAGKFANIYFDATLSYRGVLKSSDDATTIYDIDPINTDVFSALAASGGSALVGFIQSGAGSNERTAQDKMRDTLSTADKTGPFLSALASIYTDLTLGGIARIPRGTHVLSATSAFVGDRLTLEGEGPNATIIQFDPASADVALEISKSGAGGSFQDKITGIGFYSVNTVAKTAISLTNTANVEISRVGISSGNWQGADSIGIRSYGRQSLHLHNCEIATARPLVFSANPLYSTINVDHYLIEHCELISTTSGTYPVIEIETGVVMSNVTFRNIAIVGGYDGVLWNDTTSTGASYQVVFENFRTEQGISTAAYSFNLGSTAQNLQNIVIRNGLLEPGRNGIRLRNAQNIRLDNVQFAMSTGTALDITFIPGTVLIIQNCTFLAGAAITLTNAKRAFTSRLGASQSQRGAFEVWVYEDPADTGDPKTAANVLGGILTSADITLANDESYDLVTNEFTGRVQIDSNIGTGAEMYAAGGNNVTAEISDPYGHYSNTLGTASMINFGWNAGTSRYRIENKSGGSRTLTVIMRGRAI